MLGHRNRLAQGICTSAPSSYVASENRRVWLPKSMVGFVPRQKPEDTCFQRQEDAKRFSGKRILRRFRSSLRNRDCTQWLELPAAIFVPAPREPYPVRIRPAAPMSIYSSTAAVCLRFQTTGSSRRICMLVVGTWTSTCAMRMQVALP